MSSEPIANLTRGFLPEEDPLDSLPIEFKLWDDLGNLLPKLLLSDQLHSIFDALSPISTKTLQAANELERAMLLLSFFGHAYVWGDSQRTPKKIPSSIAVPWYEVAKKLGRYPVLSYASYALHNWRRIDLKQPVRLGNIGLLQNFWGGLDEEWFVLIHIDIEMKAAEALNLFIPLQEAALSQDINKMQGSLQSIRISLENMCQTLDRMSENCDPYIYYNRVRPFIHGWKDNPVLPEGLIYEGVSAFENIPQRFRGETGAQSSIIPAFDALFGISHRPDPLRVYLMEMREYMPMEHRAFIERVEKNGSIRQFIFERSKSYPILRDSYNACLNLLSRFRKTHLSFAAQYIQKQHQTTLANPTNVGTGGTPFMEYLRKHKDETLEFLID